MLWLKTAFDLHDMLKHPNAQFIPGDLSIRDGRIPVAAVHGGTEALSVIPPG